MGVKRVTKKFLKYLMPTLVVLMVIPFTERGRRSRDDSDDAFGDTIRCALALDEFDKLSKGLLTGYNYELVRHFSAEAEDSSEVFLGLKGRGINYFDSLRAGSLDILIIPKERIADDDSLDVITLEDTTVAWVVKADHLRGNQVMKWFNSFKATPEYSDIRARFFMGYNPYRKGVVKDPDIISPYDDLIKKYSKEIGWDWRLYAALIWCESKFRIQARSPKGASGLMQMMPRTATRYEVENLLDPEKNIRAGALYLKRLRDMFDEYAVDEDHLTRLMIAAYNSGEGRVLEDLDGREKSAETIAYVRAVLNQYDVFRKVEPRFHREPIDTAYVEEIDIEEPGRADSEILLSPDSLGRIDSRNEEARNKKKNHND